MCSCTPDLVCLLCYNKHILPNIAKAHKFGTSILNRDFVVTDSSVNQKGRELTSNLYPMKKKIDSGVIIDITLLPYKHQAVKFFEKQPNYLVDENTITLAPRKSLPILLKARKENGVKLSELINTDLEELDKLVQEKKAKVCAFSNAAFFLTSPVIAHSIGTVTLFSVLWKTSRLRSFQNGESFAKSAYRAGPSTHKT